MSSVFVLINCDPIYTTKEEAINNIKVQIGLDYPRYDKYNVEYNVRQSDVNNKWYIEKKLSHKININKQFVIEI